MHISSGRRAYGLCLSLLTALLWGILPIKLKQVLQAMDPVTVTWFRLLVSGALLFVWLASVKRLPSFKVLGRKGKILVLAGGGSGWSATTCLYLIGLRLLSPGTTQLLVQVGPIFLLIGSIFLFKERFSVGQGIGLLVLLIGFGLFFNQRLVELFTSLGDYTLGVLVVLLASTIWTFYGLSQKQLLTVWNSLQVMMVIYLFCALLLTPWAHPAEALALSPLQGWLLLACCLNTLVAYGAFAEALAHWHARLDAAGHAGSCRVRRLVVAGLCAGRRAECTGLWWGTAGSYGVGTDRARAFADCRAAGAQGEAGPGLTACVQR